MTGEKIRSLRRDHEPNAAAAVGGTFTGGRTGTGGSGKVGNACRKSFRNHHHGLQLKTAPASSHPPGAPALPRRNSCVTTTSASQTLPAGTNPTAVLADGGSCLAHHPVHECVFKGDVKRLSSLIRTHSIGQKDNHGNTPLHLAVMLGNKECAHLLLAHNVPGKVKHAQGWSPLAEAIGYGDRQMITALLRKLKQQSRESVEEKRPRLVKSLKELAGCLYFPEFCLLMHVKYTNKVSISGLTLLSQTLLTGKNLFR
uniref:Ankyrin repeat domain-containing protein 13C n=1 Tax=Rhinolophus ferrumequinum TaxID=59479 RepID=A0A671EEN0_RHIFE